MQTVSALKSCHALFGALLSVTAAVLALGCEPGEPGANLTEGDYLLDSAQGFEPVPDTRVRLSLDEGELSFNAGCNTYSGAFSIEGGRLVVAGLGSTEIGCAEPLQEQDEWLASFVTSRPQLAQDGDRLTLTGEDATLVFLAREVADPDRPLMDRLWTIDTFISQDAASAFPLEQAPTLTFRTNGEVEVFTGCNQGMGRYEVKGTALTFSSVGYTKLGCPERAAAADAHVRAVIQQGETSFDIEGPRLTILRSNGDGLAALAP